jgi:peptide deformylase
MALLNIVRMGDPVLRSIAAPIVDPTDPAVALLAQSMIQTMIAAPGVGLAAPQVAQGLRLIVMRMVADRGEAAEAAEPDRIMALVNPEIVPLDDAVEQGWEGCLSIPDLRGIVPRLARIGYRGRLVDGTLVEREATGFQARILQHEVDHLDGILYLDRMTDLSSLGFASELEDAARDAVARGAA